ncbi:MAG: adenine phosphoribosyltransferase [Acidobacteria bacterium]|nr:MAG: adenine phosphoribosyltransferase [Acidobacteriota bacterium]RPJ58934.1 MAG: adenine phosphoribosyltransferase [Acidobacteriota bacterium]
MDELKRKIREIPDFPKPGILFYDVTTLLKDPQGLRQVIEILTAKYIGKGIQKVVGIEARGFILGSPLAYNLGAGFVPVRKPGKLPGPTFRAGYQLEYGKDCLEIHQDAIEPGEKVLVVDDLMATGGTACATAKLVAQMRGELVGLAVLVELEFLHGRQNLAACDIFSILKY